MNILNCSDTRFFAVKTYYTKSISVLKRKNLINDCEPSIHPKLKFDLIIFYNWLRFFVCLFVCLLRIDRLVLWHCVSAFTASINCNADAGSKLKKKRQFYFHLKSEKKAINICFFFAFNERRKSAVCIEKQQPDNEINRKFINIKHN